MLPAIARMPALRLSMLLSAIRAKGGPRLRMPGWRQSLSSAVLATMAGLYAVAMLSFGSMGGGSGIASARVTDGRPGQIVPPAAEPLQFRAVAPEDAVAINAAVPVETGPNPAARAFAISFTSAADQARSLACLTSAIYYEAATEPLDGQRAVAQVVLNRVRHPAYPKSVCGVVWQGSQRATGCQFTFTCDGSLRRAPMASYWARARKVAEEALAGKVYAPVGWATHYHTNWVVPYWSSSLTKAAIVGTHIFYRWTGGWGRPPAFSQRYAGLEPDVSALGRRTAMPVELTEGEAIDAAAAAAAAAQAALTPVTGSIDSFQRAVLRRYEPISAATAANTAIARSGETASASHRWAMGADGPGTSGTPLGRRAETPAATPAAPAAPRCLEGVRRVGEKEQPADATRC